MLDVNMPIVMGILNVTPDSFFDGGKFNDQTNIVNQVERMLADGASIIDIGAVSSKPGAELVSEEEEIARLIPAVNLIHKEFPHAVLSVDTFRSSVAMLAIEKGASVINDISAGALDKNMFATIASLQVPYLIMHMQGTPQTMQLNPVYKNVTLEVMQFFVQQLKVLRGLGVKDVLIDPGFGFGKTTEHNYQLLQDLKSFQLFDCPVVVGVSRKGMINKVIDTKPEEALNGTTAVNTIALMNGANILRVHDVKEAVEAIKIVNKLNKVNTISNEQ